MVLNYCNHAERNWYGKYLNDSIVEPERRFHPLSGSSRRTVSYRQSYTEPTVGSFDQAIVNSCMIEWHTGPITTLPKWPDIFICDVVCCPTLKREWHVISCVLFLYLRIRYVRKLLVSCSYFITVKWNMTDVISKNIGNLWDRPVRLDLHAGCS